MLYTKGLYQKGGMKQLDFEAMRSRMVEDQLIPRGISDKKVLDAFRRVARHEFIPEEYWENAYADYPIPIGDGQTISQPYMVALMTECLALKNDDKILEVGTGSGYQTAILAEIVKKVYSVERFTSLAESSQKVLDRLGYKNCKIKVGDGTLGWEGFAPYDGIIVTAGAPGIPESLVKQLNDKGRLVIPIGRGTQVLTIAEKNGESLKMTEVCACVFVPLIGKEGWSSPAMDF